VLTLKSQARKLEQQRNRVGSWAHEFVGLASRQAPAVQPTVLPANSRYISAPCWSTAAWLGIDDALFGSNLLVAPAMRETEDVQGKGRPAVEQAAAAPPTSHLPCPALLVVHADPREH